MKGQSAMTKTVLWVFAALCQCTTLLGQGTINFANSGPGYEAKVFDTDHTSPLYDGLWAADLFWAPGVVTDSTTLFNLNQPALFSDTPGFFFGGLRTIPLAPGSIITAQVRVWNSGEAPSWAAAAKTDGYRVGESILFQVTLADPNAGEPPSPLLGLNGHPWNVDVVHIIPEPSLLALVGLGLLGLLVRRGADSSVGKDKSSSLPK